MKRPEFSRPSCLKMEITKYLGFLLKLSWFVICFSGNLYQIGQISDDFMQYQIVTTINVNFPDTFTAPAVSVCFFETDVVDWDKLEES